jgi:hypothetical protein
MVKKAKFNELNEAVKRLDATAKEHVFDLEARASTLEENSSMQAEMILEMRRVLPDYISWHTVERVTALEERLSAHDHPLPPVTQEALDRLNKIERNQRADVISHSSPIAVTVEPRQSCWDCSKGYWHDVEGICLDYPQAKEECDSNYIYLNPDSFICEKFEAK